MNYLADAYDVVLWWVLAPFVGVSVILALVVIYLEQRK